MVAGRFVKKVITFLKSTSLSMRHTDERTHGDIIRWSHRSQLSCKFMENIQNSLDNNNYLKEMVLKVMQIMRPKGWG